MIGFLRCFDDFGIVMVSGSTIGLGVAVQDFLPVAVQGQTDFISRAGNRCEIANDRYGLILVFSVAEVGNGAVLIVVVVNPLEAFGAELFLVQGRGIAVVAVQCFDPSLYSFVEIMLRQPPLQASLDIPLAGLTKLIAHEQQLCTRVGEHIAVEQA